MEESSRSGRISVWMLPSTVGSVIVAAVLEMWILGARGIEGSEPLAQQGAWGYVALLGGNLAVLLAPSYVGVYFGVKGQRHGEGRLAVIGTAINAGIVVLIWALVLRAVVMS